MENNNILKSNSFISTAIILLIVLIFFVTYYFGGFAPVNSNSGNESFVVLIGYKNVEIISKLYKENFIRSEWAFNFALNWKGFQKNIKPGGYKISKSMNVWKLAEIFIGEPYMKWVTIPEGLRKEEIAKILGDELGWDDKTIQNWITRDTTKVKDYEEGVYFPDTYLIPLDEKPISVAKRLQNKFQEKYSGYSKEALKQNIRWFTVLRLASIIQREAGGKSDMPIISGILWNRLDKNMRLEVDCTLQYARGDVGKGWWAPIDVSDKKNASPFNTYMYKGLPPGPISNPGIDAIGAVLKPEKTQCLFYLHDKSGGIHCSKTYDEHKTNIEKYLWRE